MRVEFSTNPNNQVTADDSPGTSNSMDWSGFVLSVDRRGEECEARPELRQSSRCQAPHQ